jgi:HSP20 family protein
MSVIKRESRTAWPAMEFAWPDERIDRAFRDMFRDFFAGRALGERFADGLANPIHLEEFVDNDTCVIRAELPGIDPDKDVEITVADGVLDLRAHREERTEDKRPDGYRSEFHYGSFRRAIRLPKGMKEEDVKATYKDGILEVRVPIGELTPAPTKIPVEHS